MAYVSTKMEQVGLSSRLKNGEDLTLIDCAKLDFDKLVPLHPELTLEYNLLSIYLQKRLKTIQDTAGAVIDIDLVKQLIYARKIAIFLAYLHKETLDDKALATNLRHDEKIFRDILNQRLDLTEDQKLQDPWQIQCDFHTQEHDPNLKIEELDKQFENRNAIILFKDELFYTFRKGNSRKIEKVTAPKKKPEDFDRHIKVVKEKCSGTVPADTTDVHNAINFVAACVLAETKLELIFRVWRNNIHIPFNWLRVGSVRGRRLLNCIRPLLTPTHPYHNVMDSFEVGASPFFTQVAWAFYAPRLLINTGHLFKHAIPGYWMSKEEKELKFSTRMQAVLQRRGFEFANDIAWIVSGLVCAFWLTGSLLPVASYLVAALYAYDILIAGLSAMVELRRLYRLKESLYKDDKTPEGLKTAFNNQFAFQKKMAVLSVSYMAALTLAISLTIPLLAANPLLPLIGAALLVGVTILFYTLITLHRKNRPTPPTLNPSHRYQFFTSPTATTGTTTPTAEDSALGSPSLHSSTA